MSKRCIEVVSEFGTFKRRTNRDYRFVVICAGTNEETVRREHAYWVKSLRSSIKSMRDAVSGERALYHDHEKDKLASYPQEIERLEGLLVTAPQRLIEKLSEQEGVNAAREFHSYGWSGTLVNARRSADKAARWASAVKVLDLAGREVR
jgi:hypothetical protein